MAVRKKRLPRCKYSQEEMVEIFSRFRQQRPEPKGELNHSNPFTLVVAVALSAQATDVGVNKATLKLFKVADTPEKMVALGEDKIRDYIKTIGLYRNKAKNVFALSRMLIEDFDSIVPQDRDTLTKLPGVGRKTANVVVSMAFGQPTIAVDTHILRIGNRIGMAPAKTPDDVEAILEKNIPEEFLYHAHHWLILHGRYTCKARKPECEACIIADICKSKEKSCDIPMAVVLLPEQQF
ncbi:MAG: endonuclease III [Rhizobiales bacterium]|nr:endonuclease III [Hyphomicrobiales bacterium]